MAETFRQSCDGPTAFDKASKVHSTINELRTAEQELNSRIAQQECEIERMQDLLDSVESIRRVADPLRTDQPRILPFTSSISDPTADSNPQDDDLQSGVWTRFMHSSCDESGLGGSDIRLESQMSALEKELAAGESELQMAQQSLQTLLCAQRDRELEKSQTEAIAEDVDELQDAKTELQAQLKSASCEAEQLRDRIATLENAQVEQDEIDRQLGELRDRQEKQQSSFASEIQTLHGHIEESNKIESCLRTELANAVDMLKQYKHTAEATESSRQTVSEELLQSVHRAESYKRRLESSTRTAAEQREKLRSQLSELTSKNETLQANLDATVKELEARSENETQLQQSLETQQTSAVQIESELETLRLSYSNSQAEIQLLRTAVDELNSRKSRRETELEQSLATQCESTVELQFELEQLQATYSSSHAELQLLCAAIDELTDQKANHESELTKTQKKLSLFKQSDLSIKAALEKERQAASTIQTELDQLCETHSDLQKECAGQIEQIEMLIAEKEALADESVGKGKSLNVQTAELLKLRATHETLSIESRKQTSTIQRLMSERERFMKEDEAKEALLEQRHHEVEQLETDRSNLSRELAEQTDQVQSLVAENKYLVAEDKRKEETLAERKRELAKLCDKHESLDKEAKKGVECIETLMAENETLAARNQFNENSLETRRNELAELWSAHETLEEQAKTQIAYIEQLVSEKEELRRDEQDKTRLLQEHQAELAALRETHQQLITDSDDNASQIAVMITEREALTADRAAQANELALRQAELDELHIAHEALKSASEEQALRIEQLIAEKELACNERDEAEKLSYMNLQAAAADFENLQIEKMNLESQFEQLSTASQNHQIAARRTDPKPKKSSRKKSAKPTDDLTTIEGIGPKISQLLADKRITTFRKLSGTPVDRLNRILEQAGGNFRTHDPTTWPEQAKLAASAQWDKLERLQDKLMGGRRV